MKLDAKLNVKDLAKPVARVFELGPSCPPSAR
jgi:hypothetical protein